MRVNADGTSLYEHYAVEIGRSHVTFKCRHCETVLRFIRAVDTVGTVADSLVDHWFTHLEEDQPLTVREV
jgi:hypothetical protein